jgi:hypothetical protein
MSKVNRLSGEFIYFRFLVGISYFLAVSSHFLEKNMSHPEFFGY